jgi:hypothetical protein
MESGAKRERIFAEEQDKSKYNNRFNLKPFLVLKLYHLFVFNSTFFTIISYLIHVFVIYIYLFRSCFFI